jgi:hypothetical protein
MRWLTHLASKTVVPVGRRGVWCLTAALCLKGHPIFLRYGCNLLCRWTEGSWPNATILQECKNRGWCLEVWVSSTSKRGRAERFDSEHGFSRVISPPGTNKMKIISLETNTRYCLSSHARTVPHSLFRHLSANILFNGGPDRNELDRFSFVWRGDSKILGWIEVLYLVIFTISAMAARKNIQIMKTDAV